MYELPPIEAANDRFWALIRDGLRSRGTAAPDQLTRGEAAYWPAWGAADLVLSQTCGLPYRARLQDRVTLIGTPDYAVEGCPPGHYRSVFVVRREDPRSSVADFANSRLAFNEALSQSGWAAPQAHAAALGFAFVPALQTGGHCLSCHAVAEGRADIAAVDAVSWRLLTRFDPVCETLRVIGQTTPTPGLPLIAGPGADQPATFAAVAAAIAALDPQDRACLGLQALIAIPAAAYLALPIPAPPVRIAQPH
jgi:ABC-type phosphate/phosphonate transport system substrate-binding protein